ncbi:MAG: flavodoxin family protein [Candidatus Anammoxibacter sp.]
MKILGISGSPRKNNNTEKLVRAVLEATGFEYELISLHGKKINGCICCLGCVNDNRCKVDDDYIPIMEKIYEAKALVIGAPNYFGNMNVLTHALLERLYCFRHDADGNGGLKLAGKPGAIVSTGGGNLDIPLKSIKGFFDYNNIKTVGAVVARGAVPCFSCGFGETCSISGFKMFYGRDAKMTPDLIPTLESQPEVLENAKKLGLKLKDEMEQKSKSVNSN